MWKFNKWPGCSSKEKGQQQTTNVHVCCAVIAQRWLPQLLLTISNLEHCCFRSLPISWCLKSFPNFLTDLLQERTIPTLTYTCDRNNTALCCHKYMCKLTKFNIKKQWTPGIENIYKCKCIILYVFYINVHVCQNNHFCDFVWTNWYKHHG